MMKQTLKRVVWLLCISVALTACKDKVEIIEEVRSIKTMTVSEQATEQILKFPGLVAAVDSSDLSFEVGGLVDAVKVDIGDQVKKEQVLAVLDPEPYQLEVIAINADLIKARDKVTQTKAQYDREKRIYDQGAGVQSRLDVAEYQYKASRSAVDSQLAKLGLAKRNLRKTTLYSPYSGSISSRSVQPHEEVQAGQTVFGINATGKMEVQLAVPENSIDRIHINDPVTMTFPTRPGQTVKGRISYIGSAADQANSFPVKVELDDLHEKVKPGMTAEVNFAIANDTRKPGYLLPIQAILATKESNRGYVFVYDSQASTVRKTPVRVHGSEKKDTIVYEGLRPGDIIAAAGVSFLADGMKVKLIKQ